MIKLSHLFNPSRMTHIVSAEIAEDVLMRTSILNIMEKINERIASYCARQYIKHHRQRIDEFMVHPATQKRIARAVQKMLEKQL